MPRAIWNGRVIAEAAATVMVEGNHYFPADGVDTAVLRPSTKTTHCHWKGDAGYADIVVGDEVNPDAAWTYAQPLPEATEITGHYAFWRGVTIEE